MPLRSTQKVAAIISDAGGRVVGRTRLQKVAYLLSVTGFDDGFSFHYKHYGPYSEELATAARLGNLLGDLKEEEQLASWGGTYSIFSAQVPADRAGGEERRLFAHAAAESDAVELELAATAVFLSKEGYQNPWEETARRKPEKADEVRVEGAKALLRALSSIASPIPLPEIA